MSVIFCGRGRIAGRTRKDPGHNELLLKLHRLSNVDVSVTCAAVDAY